MKTLNLIFILFLFPLIVNGQFLDMGGNSSLPSLTTSITAAQLITGSPIAIVSNLSQATPITIEFTLGAGNVYTLSAGTADTSYIKCISKGDTVNFPISAGSDFFTVAGATKMVIEPSYTMDAGSSIWFDPSDLLQVGTMPLTVRVNFSGSGTSVTAGASREDVRDSIANYVLKSRTATASDTIDLTDINKVVNMNVGSANNLTVVANSIKAFKVGTQITVVNLGAGQTTIVAGAGVTINSADGELKLRVQYSIVTLIKTALNTWLLIGDTEL